METTDGGRPRKRRLGAYGRMLRRARIFARMREGLAYHEIALEEGVTAERIRQIVAEELKKREVAGHGDHAKLQLARLERLMYLAAEALNRGDLKAGPVYLRTIDRLDRYHKVAGAIASDEEGMRERRLARINAAAERLGYDKILAENKKIIEEHEARERARAEEAGGLPEFT